MSISPVKASATTAKASAASAGHAGPWAVSKAGRAILHRAGLMALPFLRYSSEPGVLVFASPARNARARARRRAPLTAASEQISLGPWSSV